MMSEHEDPETYPVMIPETLPAAVAADEQMALRAKIALTLGPYVKSTQAAFDLLARIDKALAATALAGGRDGEAINRAYLAGVDAFLQELG